MVKIIPDVLTSKWWALTFGITSYNDFLDQVLPLLDGAAYAGFSAPTSALALIAWEEPQSGIGNFVSLQLYAKNGGLTPEGQTFRKAALLLAPQLAAQQNQDDAVPQLIIANTYSVAINATSGGRPITNVIGVQKSGTTALAAAQAVLAAWTQSNGPVSQLPSQYVMSSVTAVDLSSADGQVAQVANGAQGGASNVQLATNAACAVVTFSGGTRNRSSQGRLYYGPLSEGQIQGNGRMIEEQSRGGMQNAFNLFGASLGTAGFAHVVISRTHSTASVVTTRTVQSLLGNQRRRIRG